jgi:hypothetical protein
MAYKKFDDPGAAVSQAPQKVGDAFLNDALRRAIQSVVNRVISGTSGTYGTGAISTIGTGGTAGAKLSYDLIASINGRIGTITGQDNLFLPKGTQAKSTYVKYLIAAKHGTGATVYAGNEGATSTAARLPACPDGYVAVGYMEYVTGTAGAYIRFGGGTANSYNVLSGNTAGTCGTVGTWVSLCHMPYSED